MRSHRQATTQTRRDAWVEVNLDALEQNTRRVRQTLHPSTGLMAVLKADAYGHGARMILPTLEAAGVTMVGVAAMDEAIDLRQAGVTLPILVLGPTPDWAVQAAIRHNITLTVFAPHHLDAIAVLGTPVSVHIKVDTGMHRIGVPWQQAAAFITHCQQAPWLRVDGVFTHLACGDNAAVTQQQQARWNAVLSELPVLPRWVHLANSAGTLHFTDTHYTMVRLGIGLFGYGPLSGLRPALGLKGRLTHVQTLPAGEGVSYNHTYTTPRETVLGTIPIGYADGVPRPLSGHIVGCLRGVTVPQVGTITMDQLMLDISAVPDAQPGEVVTLLERNQPLTPWAQVLNTIEYELMCGLRVRLPKIYVRD
jgi:alanine racemase